MIGPFACTATQKPEEGAPACPERGRGSWLAFIPALRFSPSCSAARYERPPCSVSPRRHVPLGKAMNREAGSTAIFVGIVVAAIPTIVLFRAVTFLFIVPLLAGMICVAFGIAVRRPESGLGADVAWAGVLVAILGAIVPFGIIAYYDRSGPPIVMVMPEGYRALVKLIVDSQQGIDVPLEGGKYTYYIPESGTLLIKDGSPFRWWHSEGAKFSDGTSLPMSHEGARDTVSFHGSGTVSQTVGGKTQVSFENFVGTMAEWEQCVNSR